MADDPARATGNGTVLAFTGETRPAGLRPTATPQERVSALLSMGLGVDDLAATVDVSETTVRNWANGEAAPRRNAEYLLDDLRQTMAALTDAGIPAPRSALWIRSRDRAVLDNKRPIDVIRTDPLLVLAAVEDFALTFAEEAESDPPE